MDTNNKNETYLIDIFNLNIKHYKSRYRLKGQSLNEYV